MMFLVLLVAAAMTYTAYTAISNVTAEQSRLQQQSVSPVFSLVNKELLKPLHIAESLERSDYFADALDTDVIDEPALVQQLRTLEEAFGLTFFVASENTRTQYFSDGRKIALEQGKVFWYFEALAQPKDMIADLGQVGDVHLFYDVKVYNAKQELLGIVGAGKSLSAFLERFEAYRQHYGYDFLFVDDRQQIMLTSIADLVVTGADIPTLDALGWYRNLSLSEKRSLNSMLVQQGNDDYLISEFAIDELDWRLLLMIPLEARQQDVTRSFLAHSILFVAIALTLFTLLSYVTVAYRKNLQKHLELDTLSQLPNRAGVHRRYQQMRRRNMRVALVMVDIDRFKTVNDTFGHNAGDKAIKHTASILSEEVRDQDMVGRWGGEEFIILVPSDDEQVAGSIAERIRHRLENAVCKAGDHAIRVTASFGVSHASTRVPLTELIAHADKALYQAKKKGRNQVCFEECNIL